MQDTSLILTGGDPDTGQFSMSTVESSIFSIANQQKHRWREATQMKSMTKARMGTSLNTQFREISIDFSRGNKKKKIKIVKNMCLDDQREYSLYFAIFSKKLEIRINFNCKKDEIPRCEERVNTESDISKIERQGSTGFFCP